MERYKGFLLASIILATSFGSLITLPVEASSASSCTYAPLAPVLSYSYPSANQGPLFVAFPNAYGEKTDYLSMSYSLQALNGAWGPNGPYWDQTLQDGKGSMQYQAPLQSSYQAINLIALAFNACGYSQATAESIALQGSMAPTPTPKPTSTSALTPTPTPTPKPTFVGPDSTIDPPKDYPIDSSDTAWIYKNSFGGYSCWTLDQKKIVPILQFKVHGQWINKAKGKASVDYNLCPRRKNSYLVYYTGKLDDIGQAGNGKKRARTLTVREAYFGANHSKPIYAGAFKKSVYANQADYMADAIDSITHMFSGT